MQLDKTHILAEKIARILEVENRRPDLSQIHASIERINERLEEIESKLRPADPIPLRPHPSTERFAIAEAIADGVFEKLQEEKACTFEPNGKPCDHCGMCSSRGF
jgi:hypothetical protein